MRSNGKPWLLNAFSVRAMAPHRPHARFWEYHTLNKAGRKLPLGGSARYSTWEPALAASTRRSRFSSKPPSWRLDSLQGSEGEL